MDKAQIVDKRHYTVDRIVFYNKESKWGVLAVDPIEIPNKIEEKALNKYGNISVSGNFEGVFEGAEIELTGYLVNGKYGPAFQIQFLSIVQDTSNKEGVVNFLSQSLIKGISIQNAKKIYEKYKEKAIEVVLENPEELESIKGIGKKTVIKIKDSVDSYKRLKPLAEYCSKLGLSYRLIMKLDEELGEDALRIIKEEPFKVLSISKAISFKQIDNMYIKGGGNPQAPTRLKAGFLYALENMVTLEGSTGCKSYLLKNKFYSLLNLEGEYDEYTSTAYLLMEEGSIEADEDAFTGYEMGLVFYKPYVLLERNISDKIKALNTYGLLGDSIKEEVIEQEINDFPYTLNEQQINAVRNCLKHNVSVLTGSAGSGKSTITKALSNIYRRSGFNVELLSPTAKACRRLEECVGGFPAQTIHKFLGWTKDNDNNQSNTKSYAKDTVLIVDEASMVDILLFNGLLLGTTLTSRVLLVGDNNQLPSVQAGNVLGDLIDSGKVHVSQLTDVMRQKEDSHIIEYCSMINEGAIMDPCSFKDFHYEEFGEGEELKEFFYERYIEEVKEVGLNEVQVITPYKKGELGMDTLNKFIQEKYNAGGKITLEPYRMGDKVRHTLNDYKRNVFNGETGTIIGYDADEEEITVDFGNKQITYDNREITDLTLSYVSTVHASQGSEYKVVFVILDDTSVNDFLLIRRLLYTAVSRGKQKVYILTKPYLVDKCISNDSHRPRITKLKEFLEKENLT